MSISIYPGKNPISNDNGDVISSVARGTDVYSLDVSDVRVREELKTIVNYLKALNCYMEEIVGDNALEE